MFKKVSKKEYEMFIECYVNSLYRNVHTICTPIMISYNDFSLGDWPTSMVARHFPDENIYEIEESFLGYQHEQV